MNSTIVEDNHEKKNKKKNKLALFILLLIIISSIGYFYFKDKSVSDDVLFPGEGQGVKRGTLTKDMSEEELIAALQRISDKANFRINLNSNVKFKDANSDGDFLIYNVGENIYPITVDYKLIDTGDIIFSSGGIRPDQYLDKGKLNKKLNKGTHKAQAIISIFNPDTNKKQTQSVIDVEINVLK